MVEAGGAGELAEVTVAPYDEEWRPDLENARSVQASTLAVGYGFIPRTQLSQQLGLEHGFSDDGYLRAECNVWQQSSQPHIHLAGDMAGIRGGEAAMIGGRIAALSILLQREAISPPRPSNGAIPIWPGWRRSSASAPGSSATPGVAPARSSWLGPIR